MEYLGNEKKIKKRANLKKNIYQALCIMLGFFLIATTPLWAVEYSTATNYDREIIDLNKQINDKRKAAEELTRQAEIYKKSLASKQREIASLNYQVSTINETIIKISLEKEALELNIEETNLQIRNSNLKIQATEDEIANKREQLAELVRTLYQNDQQNNLVTILATSDTLSEYLGQLQGLQNLQDTVLGGLDELGKLHVALVDEQKNLDQHKTDIIALQEQLDAKQLTLEDQKGAKFSLLEETKGQESKYQQLIQDLKNEQSRLNNDIVSLEKVAREKLNRQLKLSKNIDLGSGPMTWPVPSRTITAYFHDPDYPYRNVFEHPAIDIRMPQGSQIHAVSSGYVARAKDAGMGYSYIMLIHDNGLSTVYGHVSSINVAEGSFVTQGQIIGLTGGKPRTPGAGQLTTGPHLHFEVRLNGIPVNPLNYLPQ